MSGRDTGLLRHSSATLATLQRLHDAAWIVGAHVLAWALVGDGAWRPAQAAATAIAALAFVVVGDAAELYRSWRGERDGKELGRVLITWSLGFPVVLVALFLARITADLPRATTIAWLVLAPFLLVSSRAAVRALLRRLRASGRNSRAVAIVGATELGDVLAGRMAGAPWLGMRVVGVYDDRGPERQPEVPGDRLVGSFDDLVEDARAGKVDLVYLALPLRAEARVGELVRRLADTTATVYFVPDLHAFHLLRGRWSTVDDVPVISIVESPFYGVDGVVKRVEDLVLGSLALIVAAPVMLACAIAIKLTSPGPVLFRQRRYGLHGQVIDVLKFRTMRVQEDGPNVAQATRDDPRVTPVGRFLRRTSLDELPQLFHVVSGTMSLVGPRPHAVAHNEEYRRRVYGYMLRHTVKPGLTGWAQVNGWRGETDTLEKMEKRVEHDLEYIRRWGLLFDLRIVAMTVLSRRAHHNAY